MKAKLKILREKLGQERVRLNEPMSAHTTLGIGGPADLFYEAKTENEVIAAVKLCRQLSVPYFILGGGSNLLVSDRGVRGMVIQISNFKFQISNSRIVANAGVHLAELVEKVAQSSLSGLEFLVGIPGTVGGAVVGNAGAWQQAIGDRVKRVKILDQNNKVKWIKKENCQFDYRQSRFKESEEIVLAAELTLEKGNEKEIRKTMEDYLKKRQEQPKEPSAGSIFVNPKPVSAGALIEQVGLKGRQIGQAQISPQHANFIINLGGASCRDVLELISLAKKAVKEKFSVDLKEEIKIIQNR